MVVASVFVLTVTVMIVMIRRFTSSPSVSVVIDGKLIYSGTVQAPISLVDVMAFTATALVSGSCVLLLLLNGRYESSSVESSDRQISDGSVDREEDPVPSNELLEARRAEWKESADSLANTERVVYEEVLDADGVLPQSDIVDNTEFSKATVSRALDTLEAKNLIERKRRGIGNVIILQ
jgi:uncharacterized membrane protein